MVMIKEGSTVEEDLSGRGENRSDGFRKPHLRFLHQRLELFYQFNPVVQTQIRWFLLQQLDKSGLYSTQELKFEFKSIKTGASWSPDTQNPPQTGTFESLPSFLKLRMMLAVGMALWSLAKRL